MVSGIRFRNVASGITVESYRSANRVRFLSVQVIAQSNAPDTALSVGTVSSTDPCQRSFKQAHLFNVSQIFPNPNRRPTKAQMDTLVQSAIAKYGYINERILRIEWLTFLNLDGVNSFGQFANNFFAGLTDNYGYTVVCSPNFANEFRAMFSFGTDANRALRFKFRNDGSIWFGNPFNGTSTNLNNVPNAYTKDKLTTLTFLRVNGRNKVIIDSVNKLDVSALTVPIDSQSPCDMFRDVNEFFKGLSGDIFFYKNITDGDKLINTINKGIKYKYNLGV